KLLMPLPRSPIMPEIRPGPKMTSTTMATMSQCAREKPPIEKTPVGRPAARFYASWNKNASATISRHWRSQGVRPNCLIFLDLLYLLNARDEVAQEVFDARFERGGRGRAARAGALHAQEDSAFLVALEGDVAAIHGDGGADAGGQQFLDHLDGFDVFIVEKFVARIDRFGRGTLGEDGLAGHEMLHDGAEDR